MINDTFFTHHLQKRQKEVYIFKNVLQFKMFNN